MPILDLDHYCTSILVTEQIRLDLFNSHMFRVRRSELPGEPFPKTYQIPFAIGHLENWAPVTHKIIDKYDGLKVQTEAFEIRVTNQGTWSVHELTRDQRQIFPNQEPVHGLFRGGCIMFDSASSHHRPSHCSRHAHWFFSPKSGSYSDVFIEKKIILDEFFIYGPDSPSLFSRFHELTGRAPIPRLKHFGYMQTQHLGAKGTQQKLLDVADRLRKESLPCDTLIIDFEWGDAGEQNKDWGGSLEWQSQYRTPMSPEAMIRRLHDNHFDVVKIHHNVPAFASFKMSRWTSQVLPWEQWWEAMDVDLKMGVAGTWQDTRCNEIANSVIWQGMQERLGSERRPHLLGNRDAIEIEGWSQLKGDRISQSNQIGAHRYGVYWTGDIDYTWQELRWQIEAITGSEGSLSGFPYLNCDTSACNWKLQARWHQFTHLTMFSRSHSQKSWPDNQEAQLAKWKELVQFDDGTRKNALSPEERRLKFADNPIDWSGSPTEFIREALRLRYRLLPYIYSLAHEQYRSGVPALRPLLMAFPNDPKCNANQWPMEYLLGAEILSAPVCTSSSTMDVYLPAGENWIDFWNHQEYQGGQTIALDVTDLNRWPLFVRAGAVIPMTEPKQWIEDGKSWDPLVLETWFGGSGDGVLTEDDGISTEYQNGAIANTAIRLRPIDSGYSLSIDASIGTFKGQSLRRNIVVRANNCQQEPEQITIDGQILSSTEWEYDGEKRITAMRVSLNHRRNQRIDCVFPNAK